MQKGHGNQDAGGKTNEVDGILTAPPLEAADDIDPDGGYYCGQRAGSQGCPECVLHAYPQTNITSKYV